jgi:hypothetical protein
MEDCPSEYCSDSECNLCDGLPQEGVDFCYIPATVSPRRSSTRLPGRSPEHNDRRRHRNRVNQEGDIVDDAPHKSPTRVGVPQPDADVPYVAITVWPKNSRTGLRDRSPEHNDRHRYEYQVTPEVEIITVSYRPPRPRVRVRAQDGKPFHVRETQRVCEDEREKEERPLPLAFSISSSSRHGKKKRKDEKSSFQTLSVERRNRGTHLVRRTHHHPKSEPCMSLATSSSSSPTLAFPISEESSSKYGSLKPRRVERVYLEKAEKKTKKKKKKKKGGLRAFASAFKKLMLGTK